MLIITSLKELRHDIFSHFFDGLNCGSSVGKLKVYMTDFFLFARSILSDMLISE